MNLSQLIIVIVEFQSCKPLLDSKAGVGCAGVTLHIQIQWFPEQPGSTEYKGDSRRDIVADARQSIHGPFDFDVGEWHSS